VGLSLEEVAVPAGHEVLMEVEDDILLIVGDSQGIFYQQLCPRPNNYLNITIISINYILFKLKSIPSTTTEEHFAILSFTWRLLAVNIISFIKLLF